LCLRRLARAPDALGVGARQRSPPAARQVGVAFLACTITLADGDVEVLPRFQPLRVSPGTYRMAVVRIQTVPSQRALTLTERRETAQAIAQAVQVTRGDAVQLDFDARVSEIPFYVALIREVRAALGPDRFLSITALVSWCGASHNWLNTLPVDEIVPMTFEMGMGAAAVETLLRSSGEFENPRCKDTIGISALDLEARLGGRVRTYVFPYSEWTEPLVRSVLSRYP
jgi:hypothetical protein